VLMVTPRLLMVVLVAAVVTRVWPVPVVRRRPVAVMVVLVVTGSVRRLLAPLVVLVGVVVMLETWVMVAPAATAVT
ncbi:hypothetical protein, partial [Mycolicibacter sinensis]